MDWLDDLGDWLTGAAAALSMLLAGGAGDAQHVFQGYAEGEYVRVGLPDGGRLVRLEVARGDRLEPGAPLFALENEREIAARNEAAARLREASAQLENLLKGRRPSEIEAIVAQKAQAEASLKLSELELRRLEKLVATNAVARSRLDETRAAYQRDAARVEELAAQLTTARLSAREDEIDAAEAAVAAARAELAQAEWRLAQRTAVAPAAGLAEDTLYRVGEFVPAGAPVVSLLPPGNIKIRFFVPEPLLSRLETGQPVEVDCDGCPAGLTARISFIAPEAEFTPPVIYSNERREKLVYMVEAKPEDDYRLHPGQPVDVGLRLP